MKAAGIGFRKGADEAALIAALDAAGGAEGLDALACVADKAQAAPLSGLAARLDVPVIPIGADALTAQNTVTRSSRVEQLYGTGSVAEAAALAACGPGARLLGPRSVSPCGKATAAIAVSGDRS